MIFFLLYFLKTFICIHAMPKNQIAVILPQFIGSLFRCFSSASCSTAWIVLNMLRFSSSVFKSPASPSSWRIGEFKFPMILLARAERIASPIACFRMERRSRKAPRITKTRGCEQEMVYIEKKVQYGMWNGKGESVWWRAFAFSVLWQCWLGSTSCKLDYLCL